MTNSGCHDTVAWRAALLPIDTLNRLAYSRSMDPEMAQKIEAVLHRVKEPESQLSISQLGLVQKVRYNKVRRKLSVFINTIQPGKCACTVITALLLTSTLESLTKEFKKEFPDLGIEMI